MKHLDTLFDQIKSLNASELKLVADSIMTALKSCAFDKGAETKSVSVCRKCGAQGGVSKYGKDSKGKQR